MEPSQSDDTGAQTTRIVVVDDDPEIAELYASWLDEYYEVDVATSGQEALEVIAEETDVVFLDRKMPKISGDATLRELRRRNVDCSVAMITAVTPDVDIVDMGFDEYICKPVQQEDLRELVEVLLARSRFDETRQRSFALASKKALLESIHDPAELEGDEEYQALLARLEAVEDDLQETLEELIERDDSSWAFQNLGANAGGDDPALVDSS